MDEWRTFQKMLWKVGTNTKLGKDGEVRSPFLGFCRQGQDACCIAREIADGRIKLRQRNFHVGTLEYVRRALFANTPGHLAYFVPEWAASCRRPPIRQTFL